jgi:hypothetical protein
MKKIIPLLILTATMQQAFSQTETFDIATYSPPVNFLKSEKQGVVIYTQTDESKGAFCMIAIYASTVSAGNEKKDFANEWKDLVVTPYKAESNPKTETQTNSEGWKAVAAAAPIKIEDADAYSILTVFSGFGKKLSVLATLNNQSYISTIDSLLQNMELDKTANATAVPSTIQSAANTNETDGQFGTVKYALPKGWKVTKYPDGDIITPADIPKGEFLEIWVQSSMNFSGTMEQALQKSYDETALKLNAKKMNDVNGGNYDKQTSKISFRGWDYIRCSGGIHMGGGDYPPEYGLDLFLIKINGRFEQIAIIKSRNNCGLSRYYPSERLKYYNDIENFLFSLQFTDWMEPVIKTGIAKGDGIIGVWQGISMSVGQAKPGAELGAELKVKQLIFFSNGRAFFGKNFPVEGLDELNTLVKAENNRRDWGTYTFNNGKGVLKLPYGDIPLRMENSKLIITSMKTDHAFIKANAVDGARFNGTYALSSKNFAGEETGKIPAINFTADGKFKDNGALSILYHEYIDCLNTAKYPGTGTYEVKNYSVILNYSDGRKIKIAFIGTDYDKTNQSPATLTLSFNEDVLNKQK